MAWSDAAREASIAARQASAMGAAHQSGVSALSGRALDKFEATRDQQRDHAHHLALRRIDDEIIEKGRRALGVKRHLNAPLAWDEREQPRSDVAYRR